MDSSLTYTSTANQRSLFKRALTSLRVLYERRWLIWYFIVRQLAQSYRGSFLGIVWIFLGPLLMVGLYAAVFGSLLGLRKGFGSNVNVVNYGLYIYCGMIAFNTYSGTVNKAVGLIRRSSALVQRLVFPLEILPLSTTAANVIDQVFGFAALQVLAILLGQGFHWTVVLIPFIMVPQLLFNLGLAYIFAVVGSYLPDIQETLRAVVRLSFFVTPIIWPATLAKQRGLMWAVNYNPVAIIVDAYRALILGGRHGIMLPDISQLFWFSLFSAGLCAVAFLLFTKVKHNFADLL